ncbi:type VI secretion system Vgr family protein [Pseudomonas putida]|uniref:type VI secretion system Vgr family protein n=1 Tax=Pseudomonas putida TaxID=303 RepID=UPI0018D8F2B1|nr:type VI secretion system tip protein TssI/VgrG [Pseudomonas putida]MBH3413661.1 type VI secretion system tip protein VgrG [Pseudomonas putida]
MPGQSDLRYSFQPLAADIELEVVSFKLDEALSTPFELHLDLISFYDDVDFGQLLDKPALFTIWDADRPVRYVHGLISSFRQGDSGFHRTYYRALVEPQLARAGLRSNWRIFQQKTVPQILELMLRRQGILRFDLSTGSDHQAREFCVQAGETDLEFIARLAAEEGFVYSFEHSPKQHKLLITDRLLSLGLIRQGPVQAKGEHQGAYAAEDASRPAPVLYHVNSGGDQAQPCLRRFHYSENVRTARQAQRDYTFVHPTYRLDQHAEAKGEVHQSMDYERFDFPGRYKREAVGIPFTQTRLAGLRHDARIAEVKGDDVRLQPGQAFTLTGHPRDNLNVLWRVISAHHEGSQFTSLQEGAAEAKQGTHYEQSAVLVPGMAEWRPAPLPRPRVDGPHMATVVGPPGEEIFCDQWGRVKVSFPWDRESKDNEFSSCWVRVSQAWAGGSWGSMAIPRIGQDVIVQYVNGDPDQPIITGRTYCGNQLPPYDLPEHKTRMTIKSQTHKGDGYNELRFEDELGRQEVFIHAERDQNNVVKHDETTRVGRNRVEQVGNDEQLKVGNDLIQETGRDRTHRVGRSCQVDIGKDLVEQVENDHREITGANHHIAIGGQRELHIKGRQQITIGGGVNQQTTLYQLQASERIEFRSPGGSIVLDQQGITLNGLTLTLLGPTIAAIEGSGNTLDLDLLANDSDRCEETGR